ncbi:MAG: aminotransferase class I/II-fold pyridoxal phosphate-dependent enzyme [Myxococcales bacterium]|nr:aminotransferase class I/II-fold pyridoxal phosphate-dependent enzyme [Myxococcales bacterium]
MKIELAQRIRALPPYLFADIDRKKVELRKQGKDLIDLGIGDPDRPTPPHIVAAMQQATAESKYHRYPSYEGMASFREAAAKFYADRFGVMGLDPEREVVALIGSKEGIAHFPVAFVDPGDLVLVPDPGYPVYATWTRFMGGEVHYVRLLRENGFLPDLSSVPEEVARRAKILWINYPNNPTAALATRAFYAQVVEFALKYDIIVASDLAYSEVYYDDVPPPSFLEVPGARECGIEFHSLSKTYNMTGWRVGFAVGNAALVAGLGKVKTNTDSGAFEAVQAAAVAALTSSQACVDEIRGVYRERMDVLVSGLRGAGFDVLDPRATFYCLIANPQGYSSAEFASKLLIEGGIVATPANGFGPGGEGYVRLTVCAEVERIREAVERVRRVKL